MNCLVSPLNSTSMTGLEALSITLKGKCFMSACTSASANLRPINRFASKTVLWGFMATWFFAASPMRRSVSVKATKDGVVRFPWSFALQETLAELSLRGRGGQGLHDLNPVISVDTHAGVGGAQIDTDSGSHGVLCVYGCVIGCGGLVGKRFVVLGCWVSRRECNEICKVSKEEGNADEKGREFVVSESLLW